MAWALTRQLVAGGEDAATHRGSGKVQRGTHPDIKLVDTSQSVAGIIPVDEIRALDDWAATMPLEAENKIAIIAPAEAMNPSAANALLKLLEEPPAHLILILTVADPATLLPTIRSRCSAVLLEPLAEEELAAWIKQRGVAGATDDAEVIARLAEGRPGRAIRMISEERWKERELLLGELTLLRDHGFASVFRVAESIVQLGDDLRGTLEMIHLLLRDALVLRMGSPGIVNFDIEEGLRKFADGLSPEALLEAAERIAEATPRAEGFYTPQARMHFAETLVISLGREFRLA